LVNSKIDPPDAAPTCTGATGTLDLHGVIVTSGLRSSFFTPPGSVASLVGVGRGDSAWCEPQLPRGIARSGGTQYPLTVFKTACCRSRAQSLSMNQSDSQRARRLCVSLQLSSTYTSVSGVELVKSDDQ
jgi:hypothetical protein